MGKNPIQDGEKINPYDKSQVIAANQFTQSVSLLEIVKMNIRVRKFQLQDIL